MMRVASIMLVLVLMSSSVISGTFAKYVTSGEATDKARVAKWGVYIDMTSGAGFNNEYETHDNAYSGTVSVKSSNNDTVVAPGTSSADVNGNVTFSITGTPEVATKIDIEMEVINDIYLNPGQYWDGTTEKSDDKYTLDTPYYPVVFTLTQLTDGQGEEVKIIAQGNLKAIETALETYAKTAYYDPNTPLDATFELTWAWAFEQAENKDLYNKADTTLGNQAVEGTDNTKLGYKLTITVTQVD